MIAYLDCSSGVSGDKLLAALLDAGFGEDALREALGRAGVAGAEIAVGREKRRGIAGTAVTVTESRPQASRSWRDVRAALEAATGLETAVREGALRVLGRLAEAEARVHGVATDDVHFHELGALDTLVDVVGVVAGLAALGIDEVWSSAVTLGSGTVDTAHGTLPVPAPATLALLEGAPVEGGPEAEEMTTPTGAALVSCLAAGFGPMPAMTPMAVGYGAGSRDTVTPNVLRITIGEPTAGFSGAVSVLESNIDHLSPEAMAFAAERLIEEGALDVWQTPIVMKKGRAAVSLSVMTEPADAGRLATLFAELTGTLGVRRYDVARMEAPRRVETVETSLGPVRVKISGAGRARRVRPEYDDCAVIARSEGMAIDDVVARVLAEAADLDT